MGSNHCEFHCDRVLRIEQFKLKQLLFIKRGSKRDAAKVPKFEGDRSNFVKALKAKYDDDIWSERIALMESGKKITKANDNLFGLDKDDDGKYVCVKCWKLKHTASRCTARPITCGELVWGANHIQLRVIFNPL